MTPLKIRLWQQLLPIQLEVSDKPLQSLIRLEKEPHDFLRLERLRDEFLKIDFAQAIGDTHDLQLNRLQA